MRKISKVVHNTKNWSCLVGVAQTGIYVTKSNRSNYYFGLEEWNNSEVLKKLKIAYLDSFRSYRRFDYYEQIELINYNKKTLYHIGTLKGVSPVKADEIQHLRERLLTEKWLQKVEKDFHKINDLRPIETNHEYMQCWNSENIVAPTNEGFILNVKYEELNYCQEPINLTAQNSRVNLVWKRIINLYNLKNEYQNLFNL